MLVPMRDLLKHALAYKYAVGYFEAWDMEAILAVMDAAERTNSPIIIGFSGNFVGNPERKIAECIYHYGALGKAVAEHSSVPTAFLFNEAERMDVLIQGLKSGFNAVMYQKPGEDFDTTLRLTKYLTETAHYVGADVESEVGELPMADITTGKQTSGENTDPEKAAYFIEQTKIDALAIAAGNVHLLEGKKSPLDYALIETLRKRIDIPLVLHGGTGIDKDSLRQAIELGVAKLNVGTVMKRVYINAVRNYLGNNDVDHIDPHEVIGKGGVRDMLCIARAAVADSVEEFLVKIGCVDKAKGWSI